MSYELVFEIPNSRQSKFRGKVVRRERVISIVELASGDGWLMGGSLKPDPMTMAEPYNPMELFSGGYPAWVCFTEAQSLFHPEAHRAAVAFAIKYLKQNYYGTLTFYRSDYPRDIYPASWTLNLNPWQTKEERDSKKGNRSWIGLEWREELGGSLNDLYRIYQACYEACFLVIANRSGKMD
jgi:hypothetical protein